MKGDEAYVLLTIYFQSWFSQDLFLGGWGFNFTWWQTKLSLNQVLEKEGKTVELVLSTSISDSNVGKINENLEGFLELLTLYKFFF